MNNPFGSIPVPTIVTHTIAVIPPPVGVPIHTSPVGQATNTTTLATNSIGGRSLSSTDLRKLSNIDFHALVSAGNTRRLLQSSSSSLLISQSEVLVDEFAPPYKLGTIIASIADSDESVIAGKRVLVI